MFEVDRASKYLYFCENDFMRLSRSPRLGFVHRFTLEQVPMPRNENGRRTKELLFPSGSKAQ